MVMKLNEKNVSSGAFIYEPVFFGMDASDKEYEENLKDWKMNAEEAMEEMYMVEDYN